MKGNAFYAEFFEGFGFRFVIGAFTTFEENSPVCGGFGLLRILITSLRSSLFGRRSVAESLLPGSCACRSIPVEELAPALPTLSSIRLPVWRMSFRLTGHPVTSDAHSRADGGIARDVAA